MKHLIWLFYGLFVGCGGVVQHEERFVVGPCREVAYLEFQLCISEVEKNWSCPQKYNDIATTDSLRVCSYEALSEQTLMNIDTTWGKRPFEGEACRCGDYFVCEETNAPVCVPCGCEDTGVLCDATFCESCVETGCPDKYECRRRATDSQCTRVDFDDPTPDRCTADPIDACLADPSDLTWDDTFFIEEMTLLTEDQVVNSVDFSTDGGNGALGSLLEFADSLTLQNDAFAQYLDEHNVLLELSETVVIGAVADDDFQISRDQFVGAYPVSSAQIYDGMFEDPRRFVIDVPLVGVTQNITLEFAQFVYQIEPDGSLTGTLQGLINTQDLLRAYNESLAACECDATHFVSFNGLCPDKPVCATSTCQEKADRCSIFGLTTLFGNAFEFDAISAAFSVTARPTERQAIVR